MTSSDISPARENTPLFTALNTLATHEQLIAALGLSNPDDIPVDFWEEQMRTIRRRFLSMCLTQLGLPILLELRDLSEEQRIAVTERAVSHVAQGLSYADIRSWWHAQGLLLTRQAVLKRREDEHLASVALRVLFLLKEGGAQWLKLTGPLGTAALTPDKADAHQFAVLSPSELDKSALADRAALFEVLGREFGAVSVKVLVGLRTPAPSPAP